MSWELGGGSRALGLRDGPISWWREAVFYEIYIRSFQDSNGDGVGDLNGITSRLPYLVDLGVDAIWITPFYPSPQVDFGYDVSDFEAVDPQFGTLADFDRLIDSAHARGIRVIVDIVLNHTSDRHPWFQSSRASGASAYRDWYVWHPGREGGTSPPTNWESAFGGPAWTRDGATGEWYYHCFYPEQPDLNWRNPAVEARMCEVLRFWLERGVDGFRLDAVNTLFEDPELRDNPVLSEPITTIIGVTSQQHLYTRGLPEVDAQLFRLRRFVEREAPDALLVSEAYVATPRDLIRFYDAAGMHLPFNFFLAQASSLDAGQFRAAIRAVEDACGIRWPSLVIGNHDIARPADRYGSGDADAAARALATVLCTLRGTPFVYYGDEIGMRTLPPASIDDVRDPVGRRFWPAYPGRDGSRRPMQWDATRGAGFSTGEPWLPVAPDASARNVARQIAEPDSVLNTYRALLRLRRSSEALRAGALRLLDAGPHVLAYMRETEREALLNIVNMSDRRQSVELAGAGREGRVRFGTHRSVGASTRLGACELQPQEAVVIEPL